MTKSNQKADLDPMSLAFAEAEAAAARGEAPSGAVLVDGQGLILARSGNRTEEDNDPTAHAEILVIRQAAALRGEPRLPDCVLYVTLEPCAMCATAAAHARLRRIIFGAYDPKGGGIEHGARIFQRETCHHQCEIVGGVQENRAATLLRTFFAAKR